MQVGRRRSEQPNRASKQAKPARNGEGISSPRLPALCPNTVLLILTSAAGRTGVYNGDNNHQRSHQHLGRPSASTFERVCFPRSAIMVFGGCVMACFEDVFLPSEESCVRRGWVRVLWMDVCLFIWLLSYVFFCLFYLLIYLLVCLCICSFNIYLFIHLIIYLFCTDAILQGVLGFIFP